MMMFSECLACCSALCAPARYMHSSLAFLRLHVPLMTTQMIILRLQITNLCEGLRWLVAEFVDGTLEVHAKVEERHAEGREADEELAGQACCAT